MANVRSDVMEEEVADIYVVLETALGRVFVGMSPVGVTAAHRCENGSDFERWYEDLTGRPVHLHPLPSRDLISRLKLALGGVPVRLDFDLSSVGAFDRAVLTKLSEIPRGDVRTYAWVAREIGHPGAARAVGSALRRNPIPFLIPCHRVVRSDGRLGQYSGGGPLAKRALLASEGALVGALT